MKTPGHTKSNSQRELENQASQPLLGGLLAWLFKKNLLMLCLRAIRI